VYLLCKGAESAILDRVIDSEKMITLQHVNDFATVSIQIGLEGGYGVVRVKLYKFVCTCALKFVD